MKFRHLLSGMLLLVPVLVSASNNPATTNSSAPYDVLYNEATKIQHNLKDVPDTYAQFKVLSNLCGISPGDIKLNLVDRTGNKIPIPLDFAGHGSLPMEKGLSGTDARIVSDQPGGSLTFGVTIGVVVPEQTSMHYRDLMQLMDDYTKGIKSQAGFLLSWMAPSLHGLVLTYEGTGATMTIDVPGKPLVYTSKAANGFHSLPPTAGYIKIPYDEALMKQNPLIMFSARPATIDPLFSDSMESKISDGARKCPEKAAAAN